MTSLSDISWKSISPFASREWTVRVSGGVSRLKECERWLVRRSINHRCTWASDFGPHHIDDFIFVFQCEEDKVSFILGCL